MNPYDYLEAHREEFLEELKDLLRIPSISTLSEHKPDVQRAAEWLRDHLMAIGMTETRLFPTAGNPIVYAEWLGAAGAPTVLIYGHYDVQPADDPENQWLSDPFEPVVRDGNLYARGSTDDKGQTLTQIKAVQSLLASGQMPVNVKFLIEGEEESGSTNLYPFIDEHADLVRADVAIVSDTSMQGMDNPSIVYGLRGLTSLEIEVRGPSHDLHSGMYGGIVDNPLHVLVNILAAMHDEQGHVTVPGFYDRVLTLDEIERAELGKTPFTMERFRSETGLEVPWGEPEYEMQERLGIRPTLEVNGLVGGWTGEGGKTIIPARGLAKITCRLVPDQDPWEIEELVRQYVAELSPETVKVTVRGLHHGKPVVVPLDSVFMRAAVEAYEFGFGAQPVFMREGGSIPIVASFQDVLKAPVILMGFGLPDDNLHAPNEKYSLECFYRGMQTAVRFYETIGQLT